MEQKAVALSYDFPEDKCAGRSCGLQQILAVWHSPYEGSSLFPWLMGSYSPESCLQATLIASRRTGAESRYS